jgi:hypothetical protein
VPVPGGIALTVAVNVTLCPNTDGVPEVVKDVVVFALLTICVKVLGVLALKFGSLEYVAVIGCDVAERVEVLNDACPPESAGAPPSSESLLKNCTAPVGVPDPGEVTFTVVVNHTVSPNTIVDFEEATAVVVSAAVTD